MTNAQRIAIQRLLADGLGVEDITIRLGVDAEEVRRMISAMRISGKLNEIYRGQA